jgi:hypothetical protein
MTTLISLPANAATCVEVDGRGQCSAVAVEKPTCSQVLKSCDEALNAQVELNKNKDELIKNYEAKSALDEQIKADQGKQLSSPFHNTLTVAAGTTVLILVLEIVTGVFKK